MTEGSEAEETKKIKNTFDTTEKKDPRGYRAVPSEKGNPEKAFRRRWIRCPHRSSQKPQHPERHPNNTFKR